MDSKALVTTKKRNQRFSGQPVHKTYHPSTLLIGDVVMSLPAPKSVMCLSKLPPLSLASTLSGTGATRRP